MIQQLRVLQAAAGAVFKTDTAKTGDVTDAEVPLSFGNDSAALQAIHHSGVGVSDRTHWGRILVSGADRMRFLHNQTTNDFQKLQPGQGCETVFVTPTARTIDLVSAYVLEDAVLLLTSPGYSARLMQWMDRFIFFADKVELKDLTATTAAFSLLGAGSDAIVEQLGAGVLIGQPMDTHMTASLDGHEVRIAVGGGLAAPGYTLILQAENAASLWQRLTEAGAIPLGEQVWEQLRVQQGRPASGCELTDDINPLEAGLWHTISLSKGCYIGQETIARLHTYRGVKQQLWGIRLSQFAPPESIVMAGEEKIGMLTSCTQTEEGYFGLAYIRTKVVTPGLKIQIGDQEGELVSLPFVSHEYL